MKTIVVDIHHTSISANINGKYVETQDIETLMKHIDFDKVDRFTEEHLENNSYDGEEFRDEPFERNDD